MQLLFTLTGWSYVKDGKKATEFSRVCKVLGVEFDLSKSDQKLMYLYKTQQRRQDLSGALTGVLEAGELNKHVALVLRGRLGFAD